MGPSTDAMEATAGRTPAQQEYAKAYNRLKTRKNRKKISTEKWNAQVAYALELKEVQITGIPCLSGSADFA